MAEHRYEIRKFYWSVFPYLCLCLFAWFALSRYLNIPLFHLSNLLAPLLSQGIIDRVTINEVPGYFLFNHQFAFFTTLKDSHFPNGLAPPFPLNPLQYTYGFPLFAALTLATPKPEHRIYLEIFIAYLAFLLSATLGMIVSILNMAANATPAYIYEQLSYSPTVHNILGVLYQISALSIPMILPILLWAGFNIPFIQKLVQYPSASSQQHP